MFCIFYLVPDQKNLKLKKSGCWRALLAWAARDPNSAALQRLQIIKGWSVDGESFEQVYDVACSDGGSVDPVTHRCPDNGASVDLSNCAISENLGAGELKANWCQAQWATLFQPVHVKVKVGGSLCQVWGCDAPRFRGL